MKRRDIAVYRASGDRGNTPEEEVAYLKKIVAESGARALKFRLGGRMSRNVDSLPGRTERLIPMVREAFGAEVDALRRRRRAPTTPRKRSGSVG